MPLKSMTGFARCDGTHDGVRWHWEVRSVNGRGLDVRMRLAPGFEALETLVREAVGRRVSRGSVNIGLSVARDTVTGDVRINEGALASILGAIDRLRASGEFERPRPEAVLALRGVLETAEIIETEDAAEARNRAMLASLETALGALGAARASEGARLAQVLESGVLAIEKLVAAVAASPSRSPQAVRARLAEQVQRILESASALDEQRLYQEAALLATRADIEEELKRLTAHIAAARDLLAASEPVGRKLDFLIQEFNREANTLCSKANDIEITRAGLEMKAVIDQLREQVQNIE
jgi:uncharacterized protein (TIGR00255 family)